MILAAPSTESAFDFPAYTGQRSLGILVVATARSGSSYLCNELWRTGLCGAPNEYLNPLFRRRLEARWGIQSDDAYFATLRQLRTSANGVFGVKVLEYHLRRDGWTSSRIRDLVRPNVVVWLTRRDLVAQAVSLELAVRSGRWHGQPAPWSYTERVSPGDIDERVHSLHTGEAWAKAWLAGIDVEVMPMEYEDLVDDAPECLRGLLARLGADGAAAPGRSIEVPLTKQAGHVNARLLADYRSRGGRGECGLCGADLQGRGL